jgi:hypothetical protein
MCTGRDFANRACLLYKPVVTNVDICVYWITVASVVATSPCEPHCRLEIDCPHNGRRPERADQESDSYE